MVFQKPPDTGPRKGLPLTYKVMDGHRQHETSPHRLSGRASFSSIRENDSDLAQTFTTSKVSCYNQTQGQPADDSPAMCTVVQTEFVPPLTQPFSRLHGNWVPADSFQGWKQINLRGKLASKSSGDLQGLGLAWTACPPRTIVRRPSGYAPGDAPFERLPLELLSSIIGMLSLDIPPNGLTRRNIDLMSLLLTSKKIHMATLNTLYQKITIPHSKIFQKFLAHITTHPALGTIVRRLDFCHFNPSSLFMTASERSQARNLTSDTLTQCLGLTPYLQEFLAQEYIDEDLDTRVLKKLFLGLPRIRALDFCGCSSTSFRDSFSSILLEDWPEDLPLQRLSLHKCMTLPVSVFDTILPRLPRLTHLDVAGTRINDAALASIPHTAEITHLNLAKCKYLSAGGVIRFLSSHPAVVDSLIWLSVATDARTHELFDAEHITELLPKLPKTLKSLSLKGSKMEKSHIGLLLPLTKHLEELALGRSLTLYDINSIFVPDEDDASAQMNWVPPSLRFIDLSDMWGEIELPTLYGRDCALLLPHSYLLEVIEIPDDLAKRLVRAPATLTRMGWRISEVGSRTWVVRCKDEVAKLSGTTRVDDGRRLWKMGAESWGMRKIPVARAEVGGMYGSFMFARKL